MRGEAEIIRENGGGRARSLFRSEWLGPLVLSILLLFLLARASRNGENTLLYFAAGAVAAIALLYFSLRNVYVPVLIWFISLLGMRHWFVLAMPGLPDLSPERVLLPYMLFIILLRAVLMGQARSKFTWLDGLMIGHVVYLLLSCIFLSTNAYNIWSKSFLMATVAFFIGKAYFGNRRWLVRLFALLVLFNVYHAVTSVAEHFNWTLLVWPKRILDETIGFQDPGRSRGLFLQPAVLGTIMAMALPMQFYFMVTTRSRVLRLALLASVGLVAMGQLFTYTRANWLAAAGGILAMAIIGWRRYSGRVLQLAGIAAVLIGAGLISFASDEFLQKRLHQEHTITGRINTLATAYRMFRDNPIFGVGLSNYSYEKANYREPIHVPFYGLIKAQTDKSGSPHDIYIAGLAEEGLFGMAMQFSIYFLIASGIIALYRRSRHDEKLLQEFIPVVTGAMVAYLIGGLGFDYRYFESLSSVFYVLAGAMVGYRSDSA